VKKKEIENRCNDCRYYLPVDVFHGLCKISKEKILPETKFCEKAERLAKCKFCRQYIPEMDFLGKCVGRLAYPDMVATTCADFKWISLN